MAPVFHCSKCGKQLPSDHLCHESTSDLLWTLLLRVYVNSVTGTKDRAESLELLTRIRDGNFDKVI